MKKTAILIDGEWFRRGLQATLPPLPGPHGITADVMYRNALLSLDTTQEELYRIFYYDCPPYAGQEAFGRDLIEDADLVRTIQPMP